MSEGETGIIQGKEHISSRTSDCASKKEEAARGGKLEQGVKQRLLYDYYSMLF